MMASSVPTGARDSVAKRASPSRSSPRRMPKKYMAAKQVTIRAVNGCPRKPNRVLPGAFAMPVMVAAKMNNTGSSRMNMTSQCETEAGLESSTRAISGTGMNMRRAIQPPYTMPPATAMGNDMAMP